MSIGIPTAAFREIIEYIHRDPQWDTILRACMLVNKAWAKIVIPVYWKAPFKRSTTVNGEIMKSSTLIRLLNEEERSEIRFQLPPMWLSTVLPYPYFIKELDLYAMFESVGAWVDSATKAAPVADSGVSMDLFLSNQMNQIIQALLKMFDRYSARLNVLGLIMKYSRQYYFRAADAIALFCDKDETLFSDTNKIIIDGECRDNELYKALAKTCRRVEHLAITVDSITGDLTKCHNLSLLISAQQSLVSLSLCITMISTSMGLNFIHQAILDQSKTLSYVQFDGFDFSHSEPLHKLALCKCLKKLEFINCQGLNSIMIFPLTVADFPVLKEVVVKNSEHGMLQGWARGMNARSRKL
ncbi:9868_t:CDS:2 [Paraglomus brasilianum]|uniref:9868_t:CDS:1 n=1 Tax=Paraglomus brasilianum TaxID=144538 RepID=A0A9N9DAS0_9GLOM|nr:9868_t:CDS:2 [Paraglomus brasilianum]